jgi:hypothetical protein
MYRSRSRSERRRPRATALIAGAALAVVAVVVVAIVGLSGSSSKPGQGAGGTVTGGEVVSASKAAKKHARPSHTGASSTAAPAAQARVVVLNGTESAGLAHRVSGKLRQSGYSLATAQSGHPPGSNQVSVVEYASGHRADAEGVARAAGVTQVQPMEASVASLSGSAAVVVIVGLDKAATGP